MSGSAECRTRHQRDSGVRQQAFAKFDIVLEFAARDDLGKIRERIKRAIHRQHPHIRQLLQRVIDELVALLMGLAHGLYALLVAGERRFRGRLGDGGWIRCALGLHIGHGLDEVGGAAGKTDPPACTPFWALFRCSRSVGGGTDFEAYKRSGTGSRGGQNQAAIRQSLSPVGRDTDAVSGLWTVSGQQATGKVIFKVATDNHDFKSAGRCW